MSLSIVPVTSVEDPHLFWLLDRLEAHFPPCERETRDDVMEQVGHGTGLSNWIFLSESDERVGFARARVLTNSAMGWIVHLALETEIRGRGLGAEAFELVRRALFEQCPTLQGIFLEVERVEDGESDSERMGRTKRLEFFRRLGAILVSRTYVQPPAQEGQGSIELNLLGWDLPTMAPEELVRTFYAGAFNLSAEHPYVARTVEGIARG